MSFAEVAMITGDDLVPLLEELERIVKDRARVFEVLAVVDEGTLKLKINQRTWSPPMGQMDPTCEVARGKRAYTAPGTYATPGGRHCRCDWLGEGTPEHNASPMCISLRPDADRDPA